MVSRAVQLRMGLELSSIYKGRRDVIFFRMNVWIGIGLGGDMK